MMMRRIITIDEEACDGCGLCVTACHEGAIAIVDGKARLVRDEYCDGLGDCLPACPTGAIAFEMREAAPFDEEAVKRHLAARKREEQPAVMPVGCPGSRARVIGRAVQPAAEGPGAMSGDCPTGRLAAGSDNVPEDGSADRPSGMCDDGTTGSELSQWPVQIQLVPVRAPFFDQADLLVAADCSAFACGDFHRRFIRGRVTLIGCPKLDMADYSRKLAAILQQNEIRSVTVVRMEVPCCGGIELAVQDALAISGKRISWQVAVLSRDGTVVA